MHVYIFSLKKNIYTMLILNKISLENMRYFDNCHLDKNIVINDELLIFANGIITKINLNKNLIM